MGIALRIVPVPDAGGPHLPLPGTPEADLPHRDLEPGDMWFEHECWAVVLPNYTVWYSGIAAADGAGEAPAITVTPSINDTDPNRPWHGWIRNGELVSV